MNDVHLVQGDQSAASTATGPTFVEVYNRASGRSEMIPEDWLDSPVLNHDVNGDLLERVVPVPVEQVVERPTEHNTHAEIDDFAHGLLGADFEFPEGTKTRADKMAVLDELAPAPAEPESSAPSVPEPEPGVQLTGPVSDEPVIPALQTNHDEAPAGDEEN